MPDNETYMGAGSREDPTLNVRELLEDAITSLKELFQAEIRRVDERHNLLMLQMRELSTAEAKRIDAIRDVDATAVRLANDKAVEQATVLANQVATSAETLRALVATTAATVAANMQQQGMQLAARIEESAKNQNQRDEAILARIGVLEKAHNESQGRSGISVPLLLALVGILSGIIGFIINSFLGK